MPSRLIACCSTTRIYILYHKAQKAEIPSFARCFVLIVHLTLTPYTCVFVADFRPTNVNLIVLKVL